MKISYKILLIAVLLIMAPVYMFAQNVGINSDGSSPNSSAMLDVKSTTKGMLIPRMTSAQIGAIVNPADGLQVHCTSDNKMYIYVASNSNWKEVAYGNGIITPGGAGTCGQPFTDARNGKIYNTIYIGSQCWMAQNLNIGLRINGIADQINNGTIEKYCYQDIEANCDTYGGLYQWDEMMQYVTVDGTQGICPTGWHLPTTAAWTTLTSFLGGETAGGGKMKSTGTIEEGTGLWRSPNRGATNGSGFTALPGGYRWVYEFFYYVSNMAYFWSSSKTESKAWMRGLLWGEVYVKRSELEKIYGLSVRCIRN